MKTEINLAAQRQVQKRRLRKFFLVSIGAFIVVFGATVLILLYNLTLKIQISSLEDEERQLSSQIEAQGQKKNDILILRERIAGIQTALSMRKSIDSQVIPVVGIAPVSSTVGGITYEENEVKMTVKSDNLNDLSDLIDNKIAEIATEQKNEIQNVEISSFGISEADQIYSVNLSFTFKGEKSKKR